MLSDNTILFQLLLDLIKKEKIGTVTPSYFIRLFNECQLIWTEDKKKEIEEDQKRIEDLEVLRIATDGKQKYGGIILHPLAVHNTLSSTFSVTMPGEDGEFFMPFGELDLTENDIVNLEELTYTATPTYNIEKYPRILRIMNCMLKMWYWKDSCLAVNTVSDWERAYIMRTDERSISYRNPYRKPQPDRPYYEIINNMGRVILSSENIPWRKVKSATDIIEPWSIRLEYLRYPQDISWEVTDPLAPLPEVTCELLEYQRKEIIDLCARTYIERAKDDRYKTFLTEQQLNNKGK